MSTSDRTMSQVRAILQRLDRSIDQARERRTHPGHPPAPAQPAPAAPAPAPTPSTAPLSTGAAPAAQPSRPPSPFGRAQPLNRPNPQPLRWGS